MRNTHLPRWIKSLMAAILGTLGGCNAWYLAVQGFWPAVWQKLMVFQQGCMDQQETATSSGPVITCLLFAMPFMLILGLPLQALLQRFGLTGYLSNVAVCVLLGGLLFRLFGQVLELSFVENVIFGLGLTLTVGSVVWLIRRPDKDRNLIPVEGHF